MACTSNNPQPLPRLSWPWPCFRWSMVSTQVSVSQDCSNRMLQTKHLEAEMCAPETLKLEDNRGSCTRDLAASETRGETPSSLSFWWDRAPWLAWLAVVTSWALPPLSHRNLAPTLPRPLFCVSSFPTKAPFTVGRGLNSAAMPPHLK